MAKGLTRRQQDILDFVIECIREQGLPPTIAEIGAHFGIASTNGVNDHLVALEKKGYIERSSKARDIRITEQAALGLYQANVATLPLVGRIAAGAPLLAVENVEDFVPVRVEEAKPLSYCLRVSGDSMIEDGIFDGDILIVDGQRRPKKNDIVVALVEDEEATVKRYLPQGDHVELHPANAAMRPMRFHARQVKIQGVVVGLQRAIA